VPEISEGDVLVRVRAACVAGDDWHLMRGEPFVARLEMGIAGPKRGVPGNDVSGVVEACGSGVTDLRPGDEVFGWCEGAFAERARAAATLVVPKPSALSFEEAAAVPTTAVTALQALRDKGEIREGSRVLVLGASGGVGTFAVQIAKAFGAHVTGACSARSADLVRALGADRVLDYAKDDFASQGPSYDLIVYLAGRYTLSHCRRALAPAGILVLVGGPGGRWLGGVARWPAALALSPFLKQKMRPLVHEKRRADLLALSQLLASGAVRPAVSATYPLEQVHRALDHSSPGHGRGKVVLTLPDTVARTGVEQP